MDAQVKWTCTCCATCFAHSLIRLAGVVQGQQEEDVSESAANLNEKSHLPSDGADDLIEGNRGLLRILSVSAAPCGGIHTHA